MSSLIPEMCPNTVETSAVSPVPGGTCPILPIQLCIIWASTETHVLTKLARDVWFAALMVQFWRSKHQPGQSYRPSPQGFRIEDVAKVLGIAETKLRCPLRQLDQTGILQITEMGPFFTTSLEELSVPKTTIIRIQTMFEQLHPNTRDKVIAIPRRILKLIVQCRRKTVRLATLLGLLLRVMLEKRVDQYGGHKGCCKAKWIAQVFNVGVDRVKTERRKLIQEGWFIEEPTPTHVQKRFGLWLRLNLHPSSSPSRRVDNPTAAVALPLNVTPQNSHKYLKLQPLFNPKLPSEEGISNNQNLNDQTPGVSHHSAKPTWNHITTEDLTQPERRQALFQDALQYGILRDSASDRLTFFAAIARTLRLKPIIANLGGFLRKLVETPTYHLHITQTDEDTALRWLRDADAARVPGTRATAKFEMAPSKDALIVQELKRDLERVMPKVPTGLALLSLVQHHGYLNDWTHERWERAEIDLAQSRLWPRAP